MTVLFSSRQKYLAKVMFRQILQFVTVSKIQQIKVFNCTGTISFKKSQQLHTVVNVLCVLS